MLRYTGNAANEYEAERFDAAAGAYSLPVADGYADVGEAFKPIGRQFPAPRLLPANALATKLNGFVSLNCEEVEALGSLLRNPRMHRAEQGIVHEGSQTDHVCVILNGLAYRYKILAGGRRQIHGYLLPGDISDVHFRIRGRSDYGIALLCDAEVVKIANASLANLLDRYPKIEQALSLAALAEISMLRELLMSIGQRNAYERLSHFFCEMAVRLRAIGRVDADGSFDLPVNQAALADTIGLTPVHVNRTLQRLRVEGLIALRQRRLTILDPLRLAQIAGFDEEYLHLTRSH